MDAEQGTSANKSAGASRVLDGRWRLSGEPREGGSAKVIKATDEALEFSYPLAVKLIPPRVSGDEELAALLFERERRGLQRLNHPGIVKLLDGGRDPSSRERYFVFPWFNRELKGVLAKTGAIPWPDWWSKYGKTLLEALAYAHDMSVAHRDVKPANVLLTDDGEPLLTDFGIAKMTDEVNLGKTLLRHGTEPYAPRDYEDERYSFQRDVHAFAAMSVLAVAGIDPHQPGIDPYAALDAAVAALKSDENVRAILESGLIRDAKNRPESAGALLARFDRVAAPGLHANPPLPLMVGKKAAVYMVDAFGLPSQDAVSEALVQQLAEAMAITPMEGTFEDGRSQDGHFTLSGGEVKLHVEISEDRGYLIVRNSWRLPPSQIEREVERGYRISGKPRVMLSQFAGRGEPTLIETIEAHAHEKVSERRADEMAARRLGSIPTWRRILAASRAILRDTERPFDYTSVQRREDGTVTFRIAEPLSDEMAEVDRLSVPNDDDVPLVIDVQERTEDSISGAMFIGRPEQLPDRGRLAVDTQPSWMALRRQEQALDAVQYGRAYRPALLELLIDPKQTRPPRSAAAVNFARKDLDEAKRKAVRAALSSEDLLVVEGPPGTGKTTFITELILAELAARPKSRILLATQTHAALDNVLERLDGQEIRMLRIARKDETRVASGAREFLMDARIEEWRSEGIRSGERWMKRWAAERGLEVAAIEIASCMEDLGAANEQRRRLGEQRTDAEQRLAEARASRRNDPDSTAAESLFALGEEIADLREQLGAVRDDGERLAARLVELGEASVPQELTQASPGTLRRRAENAMAGAGEGAAAGKDLLALLGDWHARLGRSREFAAAALTRAQVVAATCVGYASVPGAEIAEYDLCIIDEASKANATELLVPMSRAQRWVLVGDHRQLPPFVDQALRDKALLIDHHLNQEAVERTLFDDLRVGLPSMCVVALTEQHRMVPAIGRLISEVFYRGELASAARKTPKWVTAVAQRPVAWHTTTGSPERREKKRGKSFANPHEARYIRALLGRLDFYANADKQQLEVAVLAGYDAQVIELRRLLADDQSTRKAITINVSTIDAFQGREADVTIYSVTRSNPDSRIGFLAERRRLNVALSRARDLLVIVGDHSSTTSGQGNPLREVLDHIEEHPDDCAIAEATL